MLKLIELIKNMLFSEKRTIAAIKENFSFPQAEEEEELKALDFFNIDEKLADLELRTNFSDLFTEDEDELA